MHSEEIKRVKASKLTFAHVSKTFHLPIQQAAKELGMSKSALQKRCRKIGVKQWPYRKIAAVMRSKPNYTKEEIEKILIYLRKCPETLNSFISIPLHECTFDQVSKLIIRGKQSSLSIEAITNKVNTQCDVSYKPWRLPSPKELLSGQYREGEIQEAVPLEGNNGIDSVSEKWNSAWMWLKYYHTQKNHKVLNKTFVFY